MIYFLLFNILISSPFAQIGYIPRGMYQSRGRILVGNVNNNMMPDLLFTEPPDWDSTDILFYEYQPDCTFKLIDSIVGQRRLLLWNMGDFDLDGLSDIVSQAGFEPPPTPIVGISIYESPDSFSYPIQEAWRDTVGPPLVVPISTFDIDRDGIPEIVKVLGDWTHINIYESIGDNLYEKITEITTSSTHNSSSPLACGDYDLDGQNEFVWGYSGGEYSIWECTGNNSYQEITLQQLPTVNIKDCFAVDDADGDGKPEFVVKGFTVIGPPSHEIHTFIFEATGDNTYEIIKTFTKTYTGSGYYGGYSASGDVDGDGKPEIILEAATMLWAIKAVENDSFVYFASFTGYSTGSCVAVYDIDGNGLSEVIISGNNETRIYEYVPQGVEEASNYQFSISNSQLAIYPNPFTTTTTITFTFPGAQEHKCTGAQAKNIELNIYDVSGRLVESVPLTTNHLSLGTDLKGGIYFLRVENSSSGKVISRKLIKIE